MKPRRVLFIFVLGVCTLAGAADRQPAGYPISRDQVCRVLALDASDCSTGVEVLGRPLARQTAISLRVVRMSPSPFGEQIALSCSKSECLPFVVLLHTSPVSLPRSQQRSVKGSPQPLAVHPGDLADLVQHAEGIRLTRRVICIERGHVGDVIRVRELGGKQILRAAVVQSGQLTAAF